MSETTEFDTLQARVRVLEHIRNCSCGEELVGEAKVVGAKVIKGMEEWVCYGGGECNLIWTLVVLIG